MLTCFFTFDARLVAQQRSGANVVADDPTFRDLGPSAAEAEAGILLVMDTDSSALELLPRDECMRLMGSVAIGRIVYSRQALPAVELVNFALVDGDVVIRTSAEGKLAAATRGAVVAFEADTVDIDGHADWSVTIVGQARAVSDAGEIGCLERVALTSWVPGAGGHFIRISPAIVNGRRVGGQRLAGGYDAHRR
jgi:hypothetical protein